MAAQNWVMIISELRRYQGVCYKSDITVLSGNPDRSTVLYCTVLARAGPGGQAGAGAEVLGLRPALPAGQLGREVSGCLERDDVLSAAK